MLKKRIIPILLYNGDSLVKGQKFDPWRRIGSIIPAVKVFNQRDVDELVILDIVSSQKKQKPDFNLIKDLAKEIQVPLSVGGGIREIDHIRKIILAGADKVVLNTICYEKPEIISEASMRFGSQAIVASVDVFRTGNDFYECRSYSGSRAEKISLVDHLKNIQTLGVGEIILTVINDEGMMGNVDANFYEQILKHISVPLIISGGFGNTEDVVSIFKSVNPSAVGISSLFAFTELTPKELKRCLSDSGIPVRN